MRSSSASQAQNVSTTDVNDNWDRTEVTGGVDHVGSGAGQNQLCGATSTPLPVDFARSSKPAGTACSTLVQTGYAKDGVRDHRLPDESDSAYGTSTTAPYSSINGGVVGPVALGWLPGDPNGGPYTGTTYNPQTNTAGISNVDGGGGAGSTAYRLWCATDSDPDHRLGRPDQPRPEPRGPRSGVERHHHGHYHGYLPFDGRLG